VDVVLDRAAELPDAVVGVLPAVADGADHGLGEPPVLGGEGGAALGHEGDEVDDGTEDVELHLLGGGVADADGARAGVAGEFGDLGLGAEFVAADGVDGAEPVGGLAGVQDAQEPIEELHALAGVAEADEGGGGEAGVPGPAESVVPIADAADLLGEAGGGRGGDRAGGAEAEALEGQGAAFDEVRLEGGEAERGRPEAPVPLGLGAAVGFGEEGGPETAGAVAEFEGDGAGVEIHLGGGAVVASVGLDLPVDAGGVEDDGVRGSHDFQAAVADVEACVHAPEVQSRREREVGPPRAREDADQVGAAGPLVGAAAGAVEVVSGGHRRESRLEDHRVAEVGLAGGGRVVRGCDREVPVGGSAEEFGEQGGRVEAGEAEPDDSGVGGDHRGGALVAEDRVVLDEGAGGAGGPGGAEPEERGDQAGDLGDGSDAELGAGLAGAGLDAQVGGGERAEGVLVGDVVADEDDGGGADALAEQAQGAALVGGQDAQLDHEDAVLDVDAGPAGRALEDGAEGVGGRGPGDVAVVKGDAGGLVLEEGAGEACGDVGEGRGEAFAEREGLGGEVRGGAQVELAAVAADELDIGGGAGEHGEVGQGPSGDDGGVGARAFGEFAEGGHGLGVGDGGGGVVGQGGEGAVEVAGDEQDGGAGDGVELVPDGDHDRRAPRKLSAQSWTSWRRTMVRRMLMRWRASALGN
jgi:hypothetical protein